MVNKFGEYLKSLRGEQSLREMERITGLSHTYLSTLEKGADPRSNNERFPSLETLNTLSKTLNIEFAVLMEKVGFPQMAQLQEENVQLREALGFYANEDSHKCQHKGYWSTKNFAMNLKALRKSHKFTQKQLAEMLGKKESTVRMWELNKNEPSLTTLVKLSETFSVSLDEMVGVNEL